MDVHGGESLATHPLLMLWLQIKTSLAINTGQLEKSEPKNFYHCECGAKVQFNHMEIQP